MHYSFLTYLTASVLLVNLAGGLWFTAAGFSRKPHPRPKWVQIWQIACLPLAWGLMLILRFVTAH
jgi:hypothetical protein